MALEEHGDFGEAEKLYQDLYNAAKTEYLKANPGKTIAPGNYSLAHFYER